MHLEILIDDSSGRLLLESVIPKIVGPYAEPHTWRIIAYKGIGKLPTGLRGGHDAAKRILLDRLPAILRGYGRTPGIDGVIVVIDADRRDCKAFLTELKAILAQVPPTLHVMFRLAIEEAEAWYLSRIAWGDPRNPASFPCGSGQGFVGEPTEPCLGDRLALLKTYPKAKQDILARYVQDSVCDTWELLADASYPGGHAEIKRGNPTSAGTVKHEWAGRIARLMDSDMNASPSFQKLEDALIRLTAMPRIVEGA